MGKSTLLRTITGLVHPTGGQIVFDGVHVTAMPPHAIVSHGLAMVPEGGRLFPFMTVLENLELGAFNPSTRGDERESLHEVRRCFRFCTSDATSSPARCRAANGKCVRSPAL